MHLWLQPVHLLASICTTARFLVVLCMVTAMFMLLVLQLVFKVLLMPHQQDAPIVVCPDNEPEVYVCCLKCACSSICTSLTPQF